ncbi:hypothetical protein AMTR_s00008p00247580 [Amborella trichopoda]|uniref:Uncharacterized protein n=1 Tax=Amborella trichopoda TaxID=13333 RepID=W1NIT6_AMBTC|nr:hypothetical protein AMTR_s00008p00247580 [Amborella trichopoda]
MRQRVLQLWQKGHISRDCWSKKRRPTEGNTTTTTSYQFEIEEEWDAEASFVVAEESELMSSELADYRLDDVKSLSREQLLGDQSVELRRLEESDELVDNDAQLNLQDNDSDWVAQDGFAQISMVSPITKSMNFSGFLNSRLLEYFLC